MKRTGNVQKEAMQLIRCLSLASVVFIDMISSLGAQINCWRARGAGMGELVKGQGSNPAEEPGEHWKQREWPAGCELRSWSQELCHNWEGLKVLNEGRYLGVHWCPFSSTSPFGVRSSRWSFLSGFQYTAIKYRPIFYFCGSKELSRMHGNG